MGEKIGDSGGEETACVPERSIRSAITSPRFWLSCFWLGVGVITFLVAWAIVTSLLISFPLMLIIAIILGPTIAFSKIGKVQLLVCILLTFNYFITYKPQNQIESEASNG